ncbi:hypothetical protein HD554DRAFT_2036681 [Boletus coccyginus]|nr:hypothetical protein HD554DRAFT_2036681 [Boletus coccyginus]
MSQRTANQEKDALNKTITSLYADLRLRDESSGGRITHLEQTNEELHVQLADAQHKAGSLLRINCAHEQKHQCESLYSQGRVQAAAECLLEMENTVNDDVRANKFIFNWLAEFTQRCVTMLESVGDRASSAGKQDEAATSYSTTLSLGPSIPNDIMLKWVPRFVVYRVLCDILEWDGRFMDAVECFRQLQNELSEDASPPPPDFRGRCVEKLEKLGDIARDSKRHDEAIGYYSNVLLLDLPTTMFFSSGVKRYGDIELDPSSHRGYERKHVALHAMGRHSDAFEAFRVMLSILEQSPDPHIRELRNQYVDATAVIREVVEETIRHMPRVLIDTTTGRLYDKTQQPAAFEEHLRRAAVINDYPAQSRPWQPHEPTFQMVENVSIYGLPESPGNSKFQWAWSDTCGVNQQDKGVQQESVVAMFRWYRGSSLTIIHLLGVLSDSQVIGCLWRSIWNTRGWTYQEYVASKVVRFYTENWKPYLGLDIYNHKELPIILSEMEQAMDFATQELATLQPGVDRVREKLYLASRRRTTREEDVAYSLFGIFSVPIPVIYGEGNQAVSRLLEYILTRSGNVTLLAWTGRSSSSHHSYLPADLTVYSNIVPPHVPRPMETAEMDDMVVALRSSFPDLSLAVALYGRLNSLPPLSLLAGRLTLPAIVFPLTSLVPLSESDPDSDLAVYRVTSPMLGTTEIQTSDNLSGKRGLLLVHPWIGPLLDQDFSCGAPLFDDTTCALWLIVRLRQSFGALLLALLAREQYRRVAMDSLITVRVRGATSLTELMDGICTIHIQ